MINSPRKIRELETQHKTINAKSMKKRLKPGTLVVLVDIQRKTYQTIGLILKPIVPSLKGSTLRNLEYDVLVNSEVEQYARHNMELATEFALDQIERYNFFNCRDTQ